MTVIYSHKSDNKLVDYRLLARTTSTATVHTFYNSALLQLGFRYSTDTVCSKVCVSSLQRNINKISGFARKIAIIFGCTVYTAEWVKKRVWVISKATHYGTCDLIEEKRL